MPATYESITTTTISGNPTNINITSIPTTYTDLKVIFVANASTTDTLEMQFNSANNTYSRTLFWGNGSAPATGRNSTQSRFSIGNIYNGDHLFVEFDILNYAGSTQKTLLYSYYNNRMGSGQAAKGVGLWNGTAAITTLNFFNTGGATFPSGKISVYGITKA